MDALLSAFALAAPVGLAAAWLVVKGPSGLTGLFASQRLGWPHGVQEEDPPSWDWSAMGRTEGPEVIPAPDEPPPSDPISLPTTSWADQAVRARVRGGSSWQRREN
jgi:hypothetical protein